jgi:hypothetical protein
VNLSLARIMYGTNEDFHAKTAHNAPASQAISLRVRENSIATAVQLEGLRELLHRAWKNLSGKL